MYPSWSSLDKITLGDKIFYARVKSQMSLYGVQERLFQFGIVREGGERASLYVWYLQNKALCDDLIVFKL